MSESEVYLPCATARTFSMSDTTEAELIRIMLSQKKCNRINLTIELWMLKYATISQLYL